MRLWDVLGGTPRPTPQQQCLRLLGTCGAEGRHRREPEPYEDALPQPGPGQDTELVEDGWHQPPCCVQLLVALATVALLVAIAGVTG